ncbi:MAG: helix-hairpin-helix domain-containing protein [Promethearchaeota archaeon]
MESNAKVFATVKSPSKSLSWRRAKGFSLEEIKQSGKSLIQLKEMNIEIDYFRKSVYSENIEALKSLKIDKKEIEKRKPFVPREKKRTQFKPKKETAKVIRKKPVEKVPKAPVVKEKVRPKKKEKAKLAKIEKAKIEEIGTPLTELPGLGVATAKKFMELGVNTVEDLCKENPEELASLIKGVSVDRCKNWIEDAKELIK